MALITDPDLLTQSTVGSVGTEDGEVFIDTSTKTIELIDFGNLSADGVTLKAVYSFLKEEWQSDPDLIKFDFPMTPITDEQMQIGVSSRNNGWNWLNTGTRNLIRTGGWQEVSDAGVVTAEYAGIVSLGTVESGTQAYYQQASGAAATNFVYTNELNESVKIFEDGSFDYRSYFKVFAREQGDTYAVSDLPAIGVTTMTYQVYRFPLATGTDLKVEVTDVGIDANSDDTADVAPYSGMSITYYATPQSRTIGGASYNFGIIIDGNQGTAEQIYEFIQWSLRRTSDIDAGAGTLTGRIADELAEFVGSTLKTKFATNPAGGGTGVYIDDFQTTDINRLVFVDNTSTERQFPFTAALALNFSTTLQNDSSAIYRVFFTNDNAGDDLGYDFATPDAIIPRTELDYATTNRVRAANVTTITTAVAHGLQVGDLVEVEDVGGTGYNGVFVVASTPLSTTFTYANTGDAEGSTADTGGTVHRLMGGLVDGLASRTFGYDFDTNVQRGAGSGGVNAPITVVAIGLSGAQYVLATGTIEESTSNAVSLVAPIERNYSNPA